MADDAQLRTLVANVAAAYFSNGHVSAADIPTVIGQIAASLSAVSAKPPEPPAEAAATKRATPAQIRKSITPDVLISFEDGKGYKTLRRHLTALGLTPETYRAKWGLPDDYPLTASGYSARRSEMARAAGLGQMAKKPRRRSVRKS